MLGAPLVLRTWEVMGDIRFFSRDIDMNQEKSYEETKQHTILYEQMNDERMGAHTYW
jgi:hypothetical protein